MKTITKEVNVTKETEVYVAEDGKEFTSREKCILHERGILFKKLFAKHATDDIKKEVKTLLPDMVFMSETTRQTTDGVPVDLYPYVNEGFYYIECDYRIYAWIKISDEEDINLIKQICSEPHSLEIGKWICLEYDEDENEGWTWELEGTIREMAGFLKWFGYGIVKLEGAE